MFRPSATARGYSSVARIQAATGQACEVPAFDPVRYDGDVIRARLAAGFAVVIPAGAAPGRTHRRAAERSTRSGRTPGSRPAWQAANPIK